MNINIFCIQLGVRPRNPGLVGHRTSNSLPGLLGRSHLRLMMDTNSVVDPVRVDGGSLSRVRNLRRYKEELTRAATPQEWVSKQANLKCEYLNFLFLKYQNSWELIL